ncbi:unnamed protein product [Effrenium voratum]|nr:unnamed protein product [Effrenium voratum]
MGLCSACEPREPKELISAPKPAPPAPAPTPAPKPKPKPAPKSGPDGLAQLRSNAEAAMAEMESNFDTGIFDYFPSSGAHGTPLDLETLHEDGERWATHFWDTRSFSSHS